jgi:hypothetical protein
MADLLKPEVTDALKDANAMSNYVADLEARLAASVRRADELSELVTRYSEAELPEAINDLAYDRDKSFKRAEKAEEERDEALLLVSQLNSGRELQDLMKINNGLVQELATVRESALREATAVADGYRCGGCGMDGKASAAILALIAPSSPALVERPVVVGQVTGALHAGDQVPGQPWASCHACGLGLRCSNPDCPVPAPSSPEVFEYEITDAQIGRALAECRNDNRIGLYELSGALQRAGVPSMIRVGTFNQPEENVAYRASDRLLQKLRKSGEIICAKGKWSFVK